MRYTTIACLDDLLRDSFWPAKQFFYDLIREPIIQAIGLDIGMSPRRNGLHNLVQSFDSKNFIDLCLGGKPGWETCFFRIPEEAENYLVRHLPPNVLIISYEMPPWLSYSLDRANVSYLDIRISPLRFARDLYIAIKSNDNEILERLEKFSVKPEELKLEAALVSSSVRHLQRYSQQYDELNNSLIYIGQTGEDASLVGPSGNFLRITKYDKIIRQKSLCKNVFYKSHPNAGKFSVDEKKILNKIVGRDLKKCSLDIYSLLGSDHSFELIGISSGTLQESAWFGKPSTTLYQHICPLNFGRQKDRNLYRQIHFQKFISPGFWHYLLSPEQLPPVIEFLPEVQGNSLRELHNVWWGYSTYLTKNKHLWVEGFENAAGFEICKYREKLKIKKLFRYFVDFFKNI